MWVQWLARMRATTALCSIVRAHPDDCAPRTSHVSALAELSKKALHPMRKYSSHAASDRPLKWRAVSFVCIQCLGSQTSCGGRDRPVGLILSYAAKPPSSSSGGSWSPFSK
jgi:hypothetical protein